MSIRSTFLILLMALAVSSCDVLIPPSGGEDIAPTTAADEVLLEGEMPESASKPEAIATPTQIPPTAAPTPTLPPATPTPPLPTASPTELPTAVPSPTPVIYLYGIQPGLPLAISSWIYGCDWLGVAGQVFDMQGNTVESLIVEAGGTLEGQPVFGLTLTGMAEDYGPGGYEIMFADHPVASQGKIWVQLKDAAGQLLSPQVFINTVKDCGQNLVLLNFLEGAEPQETFIFYIPLILR